MQRELTHAEREMASLYKLARLLQSKSHLDRARSIRDSLELTGQIKGLVLIPENKDLDMFLDGQRTKLWLV